ncbi:PfkB family carbohydrate kinase [Krasilnikovia sp. MM14-A1004]|uniref:PfkB family carbohydrate kinase n=1 Tax=Krasilnikovia sp. MM14-A1004 TaxID=3373541 RepID=UPI00399CAFA2
MTVRVVCVGLATVDLIQRVDRIPGADEKVEAGSAELAAGGPATNAAVAAAALGADVTLVTAVGMHPLAAVIRADLSAYGVRLLDATPDADAAPPVSAVTVLAGTGQRSIVSRNAGGLAAPVPPALGSVLSRADAVLVDGHHPGLATAAARAGRPLIVDAGSWRPVFADVLPHADVVACSATFRHPELPGPAAIRDLGARHVAVTAGPDPVRWFSAGAAGEVPVPPVAAVDTAGAGDVFHGALAVAVAREPALADLPTALAYAVAVAGIRVAHAGPRTWLTDPRLAALHLTAPPT